MAKNVRYNKSMIKKLRKSTGLSKYSFGKRFKTCTTQVKGWEEGTQVPSIYKIVQICNEFGFQPNDFFIITGLPNE